MSRRATGVERFAAEILRALDEVLEEEELEVVVAVPPRLEPQQTYRRIQLRRLGRGDGHYWEQRHLAGAMPAATLLNLCNSAPMCRENQIVTIHDAGVYDNPNSYSRRYRYWYRFMYSRLGRLNVKIITVSRFSKQHLARHLNRVEETIAVVPEGGDHLLRVPADHTILGRNGIKSRRYILTVGSKADHKNVASLGVLGRELAFIHMDLVVVGGADDRVFAKVPAKVLPANAKYVGHASDAELRALYEHAALLVFPSLYEGFGLPPLEALMMGCPVAVSPCGALPDICGPDALYIRPDSPEDIADKVLRFVRQPNRLAKEPMRDRIRSYTWRRAALALLAIVREWRTQDRERGGS